MIGRAIRKIAEVYVLSLVVAVLCGISAIAGGLFALATLRAVLVAKGVL